MHLIIIAKKMVSGYKNDHSFERWRKTIERWQKTIEQWRKTIERWGESFDDGGVPSFNRPWRSLSRWNSIFQSFPILTLYPGLLGVCSNLCLRKWSNRQQHHPHSFTDDIVGLLIGLLIGHLCKKKNRDWCGS